MAGEGVFILGVLSAVAMSFPEEDTVMDVSFQAPPAQLLDNPDLSLFNDRKKDKVEDEDDSDANINIEEVIGLTQPLSDSEPANEVQQRLGGDGEGGGEGGDGVWVYVVDGLELQKKIEDGTYLWAPVCGLLQKHDVSQAQINEVCAEMTANGQDLRPPREDDVPRWISNEQMDLIFDRFGLKTLVAPLMEYTRKRQLEKDEKDLETENVFQSPTKKFKHVTTTTLKSPLARQANLEPESFVTEDGSKIKVYTHDIQGQMSTTTTKPAANEDVSKNEHSKVILSSLFLPFQTDVTLDQVLQNENESLERAANVSNETIAERKTEEEIDNGNETTIERDSSSIASASKQHNVISHHFSKKDINIDVPIDDNGQTALHLAATLGNANLVKDLIENGANRFIGDVDGQSALIRAVHATNCFELSVFEQILDLLYPTITLVDSRGRTILHHIALTCGLKGRNESSKYYLEILLEWVVKKGSKIPGPSVLTLSNFIKNVVNKSDKYGNTCLNYATLSGNKYVVSQLLEIGADPYKANKLGVTPNDWGMDVNETQNKDYYSSIVNDPNMSVSTKIDKLSSKGYTAGIPNDPSGDAPVNDAGKTDITSTFVDDPNTPHLEDGVDGPKYKSETKVARDDKHDSMKLLESIQNYIVGLGDDFKEELSEKSKQIEKLNPVLKQKTLLLSQKRKQYDELNKLVKKISKLNNKLDNLNKAVEEEETNFQKEVESLNINVDDDNSLGEFDADQPFTIPSVYQDIEFIIEKMINDKVNLADLDTQDDTEGLQKSKSDIILQALDDLDVSEIQKLYENELTPAKKEMIFKEIPPMVVLDARIKAYQKNNLILAERRDRRMNANKELESQFKRIIGLCIGADAGNIDDRLLSSLLMSVENDPDPEIGQIRKVLKIVGELEQDAGPHAGHAGHADSGHDATDSQLNGASTPSTKAAEISRDGR